MSQKLREALEALVNAVSYKARFRDKDTSVGAALVLARTALSQPAEAVPGWKLVPVEPTEAEIDAPRDFLLGLELSLNKTEAMRKHLDMLGTDYSCLPDWFKNEDTHLTKAGKAICIRAFMLAAAQEVSK
jgi:hypothetical protein